MPKSIYKSIVFKLLGRMQLGRLDLYLNDNQHFTFGKGGDIRADLKVINDDFFRRIVLYGDIGFGESFMEGQWETSNLTNLISWFLLNMEQLPGMSASRRSFQVINLLGLFNKTLQALKPNSLKGARKNIYAHYDLSNDFFRLFLDPTMTYSSALFLGENDSLETAQQQKYDSLCNAIRLNASDHVLEIGCGWGAFAIHAAKKYGCRVTGITISKAQYQLARDRIKAEGLDGKVNIHLQDYRLVEGKFDKVVSIEMIEAVGHKYFRDYFGKIQQLLKPSGVLGLQAIIIPDSRYHSYRKSADWIRKHIFPGGLLPSIQVINDTINQTGKLNLYSMKEMGLSYAQTLKSWFDNFQANLNQIRALGLDEVFLRKWEFYLRSCEASFQQRNINVVQMVYAHPNNAAF